MGSEVGSLTRVQFKASLLVQCKLEPNSRTNLLPVCSLATLERCFSCFNNLQPREPTAKEKEKEKDAHSSADGPGANGTCELCTRSSSLFCSRLLFTFTRGSPASFNTLYCIHRTVYTVQVQYRVQFSVLFRMYLRRAGKTGSAAHKKEGPKVPFHLIA